MPATAPPTCDAELDTLAAIPSKVNQLIAYSFARSLRRGSSCALLIAGIRISIRQTVLKSIQP
jgi:hypothetical protein